MRARFQIAFLSDLLGTGKFIRTNWMSLLRFFFINQPCRNTVYETYSVGLFVNKIKQGRHDTFHLIFRTEKGIINHAGFIQFD